MLMIDAAKSWQESPTCDHTRRIPCVIMSLRDALEHDAGASCRAIAALHRGPEQAMGMAVGPGLDPGDHGRPCTKAEGTGEGGRTTDNRPSETCGGRAGGLAVAGSRRRSLVTVKYSN